VNKNQTDAQEEQITKLSEDISEESHLKNVKEIHEEDIITKAIPEKQTHPKEEEMPDLENQEDDDSEEGKPTAPPNIQIGILGGKFS